jgi:hypothetical protein
LQHSTTLLFTITHPYLAMMQCLSMPAFLPLQIYMWGEAWGDFSMQIDRAPRRADATGDFVDISCGAFHNLALNAAGECFTWGINDFGMVSRRWPAAAQT